VCTIVDDGKCACTRVSSITSLLLMSTTTDFGLVVVEVLCCLLLVLLVSISNNLSFLGNGCVSQSSGLRSTSLPSCDTINPTKYSHFLQAAVEMARDTPSCFLCLFGRLSFPIVNARAYSYAVHVIV